MAHTLYRADGPSVFCGETRVAQCSSNDMAKGIANLLEARDGQEEPSCPNLTARMGVLLGRASCVISDISNRFNDDFDRAKLDGETLIAAIDALSKEQT